MKRRKREAPPSPEVRAAKNLLRTYFISLFSCLLCCLMFLGTTLAWFNTDVSSTSNIIQAADLSLSLMHDGVDIVLAPDYSVFADTNFSPNAPSQTEILTISNTGDVDFDYVLRLHVVDKTGENLASAFALECVTSYMEGGEDSRAALRLTDGMAISAEQLESGESAKIKITLTLKKTTLALEGEKFNIMLSLVAQQSKP